MQFWFYFFLLLKLTVYAVSLFTLLCNVWIFFQHPAFIKKKQKEKNVTIYLPSHLLCRLLKSVQNSIMSLPLPITPCISNLFRVFLSTTKTVFYISYILYIRHTISFYCVKLWNFNTWNYFGDIEFAILYGNFLFCLQIVALGQNILL